MKNYTLILLLLATYLSNAQTWLTIDTVNSKYTKVFFLNENIGFVSNYQGYKKTVDGGQTWTYVAHEVSPYGRGEIHFISPDTGFRSGAKTHDGGNTWVTVTNFSDIFCFTEGNKHAFSVGFLPFGYPFKSFYSNDYSENWASAGWLTPNFDNSGLGAFDIDFADSLHGVVGSGGGNVFYTKDGAQTWYTRELIGYDGNITAVDMVNDTLAYAIANSKLYKSGNGGDTWSLVTSVYGNTVYGSNGTSMRLQFLDTSIGYYCNGYGFYKTQNGGLNWTRDTSISNVVDFHLVSNEKVYLLTWDSVLTNGGVFKRDIVDDIKEVKAEVQFSLYPNPTDGVITILADEAELIGKQYLVTDQMGREVYKAVLVNEKEQIDLSDIPKGSYFLHIGDTCKHFIIH